MVLTKTKYLIRKVLTHSKILSTVHLSNLEGIFYIHMFKQHLKKTATVGNVFEVTHQLLIVLAHSMVHFKVAHLYFKHN